MPLKDDLHSPVPTIGYKTELYERQQRLSFWDQTIIDKSRVLIVGMGGLGCEVSKNLALAGVGILDVVDCDNIEVTNLNRQMLFSDDNVGRPKADVSREKLLQMNPFIQVNAYNDKIEELSSRLIQKADLVIAGLDLWEPRRYLNCECVRLNKPYNDGGMLGYHGRVRMIMPKKTPCLVCDNPENPDETRITEPCTLVGVPRKREHCVWKALYQYFKKHKEPPKETDYNAVTQIHMLANTYAEKYKFQSLSQMEVRKILWAKIPSIITVNAIIGGIQSQQALLLLHILKEDNLNAQNKKALAGLRKLNRINIPALTIYDGLTNSFQTYDLVADKSCPVCGVEKDIIILHVKKNDSMANLLTKFRKKADLSSEEMFSVFRVDKIFFPEDIIGNMNLTSGDAVLIKSVDNPEKEYLVELSIE